MEKLYYNLNENPDDVHQAAINAKQYDTAIGLLESNIVGEREKVRREISKILKPDYNKPNSITTHESL